VLGGGVVGARRMWRVYVDKWKEGDGGMTEYKGKQKSAEREEERRKE
jgi:hypothetical protein